MIAVSRFRPVFAGNIDTVGRNTSFTCFSLQDFTRPYCEMCLIEIVGDHWLGGLMSINDFISQLAGATSGARWTHGLVVTTIAGCMACAASSNAKAITNSQGEFAPPAYSSLPSYAPLSTDLISPASFNDRFDGQYNSIIHDFLESPASRALLPRLALAEPLTTGSVPRPEPTLPLTMVSLPRHRPILHQEIIPAGKTIIGIASTYNPVDPTDLDAGNEELASGERYDPQGWTAAIRTDLRDKFGGVRFGRNYQPAYALVQSSDKKLIVKINDVGPLRRGRIIDLNTRAMSYFDPTLQLGLIDNVKVTPLADRAWALGPVIDETPISVAARSTQ